MLTLPNPDSFDFDSDRNRPVPRHGIRIALHLSLAAASSYWLFTFISDKDWHQHYPGTGVGSVPVPLWISILAVALPFILYALSVLLLSTRSEELIAAGAGIAAGISPFSLILSATGLFGAMFLSFFPERYFLPMAISLLALFACSIWTIVSAFRIGGVNWGVFLLTACATFIGLAICVHKVMNP